MHNRSRNQNGRYMRKPAFFQMDANLEPNHLFEFTPDSLLSKPEKKGRSKTEHVIISEATSFFHFSADVVFSFFAPVQLSDVILNSTCRHAQFFMLAMFRFVFRRVFLFARK